MPRLIWSPSSLQDLARLHAFLEPHNPDAARRAIAAIRNSVRILERHATIGRPALGMPSDFREWPIAFAAGYIAVYRVSGDCVVILAVRHSREALSDPVNDTNA